MYKVALILYLTCFCLYLLFSRQPDYFDSEHTVGYIHFTKDSLSKQTVPMAFYSITGTHYSTPAGYMFRQLSENERVNIIYDTSDPSKAAVYRFWGYGIKWGEVLVSLGLLFALFYIAVSITNNPTPEALMEQLNYKPVKKRKYES